MKDLERKKRTNEINNSVNKPTSVTSAVIIGRLRIVKRERKRSLVRFINAQLC